MHIYEYNKFNNIAQLLTITMHGGPIDNFDNRHLLWDFKSYVNDLKYYISGYHYKNAKRICRNRVKTFQKLLYKS
jgi:hypothetical protein